MAAFYEKIEPLFLVDYLQFGSALRLWSAEAALARLKAVAGGGVDTDADNERRLAAATLAQQLGHAFEDLAAVLAGLAIRVRGESAMIERCLGKGVSPERVDLARRSICFVLFNYMGTLKLPTVLGDAPGDDFAVDIGLTDLVEVPIPEAAAGSAAWIVQGVARQLHHMSTTNAPGIGGLYTKLKHGAIAVSDVDAFNEGREAKQSRVGVLRPPTKARPPGASALPTDDEFLGALVGEIERARACAQVVIALYLLQRHAAALQKHGVATAKLFDERVWRTLSAPCLIGDGLDIAEVIPYRRPLFS